ncbi:Glycosyltransferase involved in cell wall bisynthesis [Filimonas lacunae]|uniref:Glycosyltransferase involved in cell wall bisynthesis n=1 Tax=Filimonas lacunae TaxID=477680 RepID=A0A173MDQ9_9BACT|nr:glycosyltransferase family 2 protein [Filimonas lacunae]BAV05568.1 glycosyl transferase, group 2 family protein [Filimonas lacunae]SIT29338.1 Glycosyltransferase involved in cell wall bisynthesis [Filimonas lacunae]
MLPLSVVIITKNESAHIQECIRSAQAITSDIVVVDSGSTDNTPALATAAGATVITTGWESYAAARNKGAAHAHNNWILAMDADERITSDIIAGLRQLSLQQPAYMVYGWKRVNFFGDKKIRFGNWGHDTVYRLYNRQNTRWPDVPVHETLAATRMVKRLLPGTLLHYTVSDTEECAAKAMRYALLSAQKYNSRHLKPSYLKKTLSPLFNFIACYIFRLGFLDGREGFIIALYTSYYSWLKCFYHQLLYNGSQPPVIV